MAIHHEVIFNCNLKCVYDALTNTEKFAEFSGATAAIDAKTGARFTCFDGMISGQIVENIPNERLVQVWRVENWPPGVYSLARFEFTETGNDKTKMIFDHTGYPKEHEAHLDQGWHERYWLPLKKYLEA